MKNLLFIVAFICFSVQSYGQLDRLDKTNSVEGLRIPSNNSGLSIPADKNLNNNNSLFNRRKNPLTLYEEEEKTFSMTEDDGLMEFDPTLKDFTPKALTKDKPIKDEYRNNVQLGSFKTGGTYVEVYFRDHEYVDGDRVRVYVNGEMVANNVSLGSGFYPILVTLKKGFNTIEFEALNMGTSGPNTAALVVYDDKGNEITKNEWNLTTGMKASLIVVKE
ncbi:MAG TPA: hypothetical protein VFI78_01715 [Salinimicrobium sp.]|nr:hypothetical protein [Salinimicrobium sp.]